MTAINTSTAAPAPTIPDGDLEKRVGRGALLLTAAKFWFLISGFVIQAVLTKVFRSVSADPETGVRLYGQYSVVTGFAAIFNALVYQGTTQAVARFTGMNPGQAGAVRRAAFKLQLLLGGGLFVLLFAFSPWFKDDPALATPLRVASFILLGYAFYSVPMGSFTGSQRFKQQAVVDLSYSTLKIVCICGFAAFLGTRFGAVEAAIGGFAFASFAVLVMGLAMTPREHAVGDVKVRELFVFQFFTMVLAGVTTLATQLDLQLLEAWCPGDKETVSLVTGQYRAAQLFGTIPYQAVFAITFILFPLVSGLTKGDHEKLRGYIRQTTRYSLIIAGIFVACFVAAPDRAVGLLYGAEYEGHVATPLRLLSFGYLMFSVFFIMLAIVTASGRPGVSSILVGVIAAAQLFASWLLVPRLGADGAAIASAIGMLCGLIGVQFWHRRTAGAAMQTGTVIRVLASIAAAAFVCHVLFDSSTIFGRPGFLSTLGGSGVMRRAVSVVAFGGTVVLYFVFLSIFGALTAEDRARFARVLGRKKAHA